MERLSQSLGMGWPPAAVVAVGGVFGAWLRFGVIRIGETSLPQGQRHWAIWWVNTMACVLMGVLVGMLPKLEAPMQSTLKLLIATGFLGSVSTYSTLMAELVITWQRQQKSQALALAGASLLGGGLAYELGRSLGLVVHPP